jgi:glucosamine--fructose-6-phosphate aminotransferase (isomerizing)
MFFIGRNMDYPVALEGSHKLKEISYIHAEAYEAGELKHGALALVTEGIPVVCLDTLPSIHSKMQSNITEVKSRGACIVSFRNEAVERSGDADMDLVIPQVDELLMPMLSIVPLQLFSYYIAKERNCDVDKPRNLAKSVTVE